MPHMSQSTGTGHHHQSHHHHQSNSNSKPVKMKRTRQRVDAGEPRNSYASIANFSSRGGYHGYNSHKYGNVNGNHSSGSNSSNSANMHHQQQSQQQQQQQHNNHHSQPQQHSLAAMAASNAAHSAQSHLAPNSTDQMFASKQLRDHTSAFNAAAMAAAAASTRPEMLFDPAILQMCQSQMAALFNGAYSAPNSQPNKSPAVKFGSTDTADQLALNNPFYNANAFLSQLQSADNSLVNFMNTFNAESAAAAALFGANTPDAQLLRDILEAGRISDKAGQLAQSADDKQPKSKSACEIDIEEFFKSATTPSKEQEDKGGKSASPGEPRPNDEDRSTREPEEQTRDQVADESAQGSGADDDEEEVEEEAEAKDKIRPGGSECGSGTEDSAATAAFHKQAAKTRDGNLTREERRGRGRPPLHSLAQRRAKSAACSLVLGSSSSRAEGTSLGEEMSSASFSAKNASCTDLHLATAAALKDPVSEAVDSDVNVANLGADEDRLSSDDCSQAQRNTLSPNESQAKRARVENIVSNMLLVTSNANNPCVPMASNTTTNAALSPARSNYVKSEDEADSNPAKPQGVNGCKKRKLYQPQQSSKLQSSNGSVDTDDDIEEVVAAPEVEQVGVEAELDEGYDDTEERLRRSSPKQSETSRELDLSTGPTQTRTPRSEHLPTKRARLSDYEREYKLQQLQSQLLQKYTMQLYAQQSKSTNGSSQYPRASPVNLTATTECDTNVVEDDSLNKENNSFKVRQNGHSGVKIYDVDLLIESVTGQILSSIGRIIENSIRGHLEAHTRYSLEGGKDIKANDLLAQMLDGKYSRPLSVTAKGATAVSPNNANKTSGRGASPLALPNEASPAPKPFAYPQNSLASNFYGKQPFYISNMTPQSLAAAYSNLASRDASNLVLNGLRETPSVNSSSSNMAYNRDDASPLLPEQTEAMSLVVAPKKRRNKVTDTRLTPRTVTRIPRDDSRDLSSISPPIPSNGSMHFTPPSLGGVPVSLASLQHANDFFDPSATAFPFADQSRLSGFFNGDESDLKNSLTNGVNGSAAAANPSVVSAVAQAAAAHHLQMLAASRASPDSLNGYPGSLLTSYGRGSGTGSENGGDGSETNDTQSVYDPSMPMTSTLSPMHLRKAKLMFFYVRYPSSSILKMFFPDIKFNKNNTAQLVKWFSNFREFYYIQMEKYARQALSEGIKSSDNLNVTEDCELLRVLNLHYNRSNHIPIPENFRVVSETTLREFYKALQQNKDSEQSWKKAIYKVIARLDDNVPEYFKNPNFMEQLE